MSNVEATISNVSDTALWVAYYRAKENLRADALFHDPLASILIGERGKKIAERMGKFGVVTDWVVVVRTLIIDQLIFDLLNEGIDTVINLGAGLDTRPYRLNLPADLKWIEVDYPSIIEHKNQLLKDYVPTCHLERVALDLADTKKRQEFFQRTSTGGHKVLIITEGVIPYLTEEQVASLGNDLLATKSFEFWITEYVNARTYHFLKNKKRTELLKNSPFVFFPSDWLGFFNKIGWKTRMIKYSGETANEFGRSFPMPLIGRIMMLFSPKKTRENLKKMSGYIVFYKT